MHAFQIPFTGLLVGGMAVIMISLIAKLSEGSYRQVLKSALIVLIVKAMVSPHTPFPAYIAVSFQALSGYVLFRLFSVNSISIILLSTISMVESAIQKILILTLFFGNSLWKAMDGMVSFLTAQFGFISSYGSYWIICIYLLIYLAGGFLIAWLALRTINNFYRNSPALNLESISSITHDHVQVKTFSGKNNYKKLWGLALLMLTISLILFFLSPDTKQGWLAVIRMFIWTLSAIFVWYMLIGPLFTKAIKNFLHKKESRYSEEVLKTLSFLPVMRKLATITWQQSKLYNGFRRWSYFLSALIHAALTYSEPQNTEAPFNNPV